MGRTAPDPEEAFTSLASPLSTIAPSVPGAPERDGTLRTAGPSRRDASVLAAACAAFELVGDLAESVADFGDDGLQTMGPGLKRLLDAETHECRVDVTLELHLELEQARSPMDWPCEVG